MRSEKKHETQRSSQEQLLTQTSTTDLSVNINNTRDHSETSFHVNIGRASQANPTGPVDSQRCIVGETKGSCEKVFKAAAEGGFPLAFRNVALQQKHSERTQRFSGQMEVITQTPPRLWTEVCSSVTLRLGKNTPESFQCVVDSKFPTMHYGVYRQALPRQI